jgi:hypothetical protein
MEGVVLTRSQEEIKNLLEQVITMIPSIITKIKLPVNANTNIKNLTFIQTLEKLDKTLLNRMQIMNFQMIIIKLRNHQINKEAKALAVEPLIVF